MTTLPQSFASVQPSWETIRFVALPEVADDVEPFMSPEDVGFQPTPEDEAWWTAYCAARDGESIDPPRPESDRWSGARLLRWANGRTLGRMERESADAREIGRTLGLTGSGICEPPPGFRSHEATAYREGYAAGLVEAQEEIEFEAWVASMEADRIEVAFATDRPDSDYWPMGCMS